MCKLINKANKIKPISYIDTPKRGIANNDTEEQVVHRILNKRNELAAKRKDNETKQNRFKRLRLSEKAVLGELQDLICDPQIKITIANTLDQAAEFLEDKLGPGLLE